MLARLIYCFDYSEYLAEQASRHMETAIKSIRILSKGNLIEGYTADEVVANLSKKFQVSQAAAKPMLRKGAVLKKTASVEMAKKLVSVFRTLGLEVGCVVGDPGSAVASAPAATSSLQSHKKVLHSMSPEGRKWRAHFGENTPAPHVQPIHVMLSSLAALAGLLPAILYLLVFSLLLSQFVGVALSTADYLMGNAYGHVFSILFNTLFLIIVAFLLVKIVQPRREAQGKCIVHQEDAPSLYPLLEALCELTSSPIPSEIIVTNRMEIQLQPQVSITGLRNRDLSLRIGLPMMALKNRAQFIAVLVHHLGHYSDSNKVPAYRLVNFVSGWLENRRVLTDGQNVEPQHGVQEDSQLSKARWLWGKANALPRVYVASLLELSRKINSRVDDCLQYCADYYAVYILGVDQLDKFSRDQAIACATYQYVSDLNAQAWKHHKLLRNIPDAIVSQYHQWSEDEIQDLLEQPLPPAEETGQAALVSESRIARVKKLNLKGVYKDTSSATDLFSDFDGLAEKVTVGHYQQLYRDREFTGYIVDNSKIVSMKESLGDAEVALDEFLGGAYAHRLIEFARPADSIQFKMDHQQTIDWIRKHLFEYRDDQKLLEELHKKRQQVRPLLVLLEAGADVMQVESSIARRSRSELSALLSETDRKLKACRVRVAAVDHMIAKRIMMAAGKMSGPDKDFSHRYLLMAKTVGGFGVRMRTLAEACVVLRALISQKNPSGKLLLKIDALSAECRRLIGGILSEAVSIAVFSDNDRRSLREYIDSSIKLHTDDLTTLSFDRMLAVADEIEKVVIYHYTHSLGQLAKLCHQEEIRLNIRPLKLFTK